MIRTNARPAPSNPDTMPKPAPHDLSRRERQIMDVIFERGQATAAEVADAIPDPPSYSAVRALLRILEEKGYLRHEQQGLRYVFTPTMRRASARRSALKSVVKTFFDGSVENTVAALLGQQKLSREELDRLADLITRARKEER
jgi:predicted transcriptional regulator